MESEAVSGSTTDALVLRQENNGTAAESMEKEPSEVQAAGKDDWFSEQPANYGVRDSFVSQESTSMVAESMEKDYSEVPASEKDDLLPEQPAEHNDHGVSFCNMDLSDSLAWNSTAGKKDTDQAQGMDVSSDADETLPDARNNAAGKKDTDQAQVMDISSEADESLPDASKADKTLPNASEADETLPDASEADETLPDALRVDKTLPNALEADETLLDESDDETLPDETEAVSDQSQPSEGIIINSEGMNKIAAFDSELGPAHLDENPSDAVVVKMEPIDPEEETAMVGEGLDLSLTQSALQMQFEQNPGDNGFAVVKQEPFSNSLEASQAPQTVPAVHDQHSLTATASTSRMPKIHKKVKRKPGRPPKNPELSPLGQKILQKGDHLRAEDMPPINAMDLCLVCSAPCVITRNRKIPSLPFCRKCKKAYFYQLGHQNKRPGRCFSGKNCVIHYKNGNHCTICHHDKFQRILRTAQASFRARSDSKPGPLTGFKGALKSSSFHRPMFCNDPNLIKEALNSYPRVVLDKMAMAPDEVFDAKDMDKTGDPHSFEDLPGAPIPAEKRTPPRMFAMPYEEDVVKQEVVNPTAAVMLQGALNPGSVSDNEKLLQPPKLGPIKIPSFGFPGRPGKSSSVSTLSSFAGQPMVKRGRGRPRKTAQPVIVQPKPKNDFERPRLLSQILNGCQGTPQEPPAKKVAPEEKDIKIFVFQCGHACSSCNSSTSRQWLRQNGYESVEPASQHSHNPVLPRTDSSLYQKFIEFYNAALMSAPHKTSNKSPKSEASSTKKNITKYPIPPVPTSVVPNSANQPQLILFPPPPQFMDLTAPPASLPHSSFNIPTLNSPPLSTSLLKPAANSPPAPASSTSSIPQLSPLQHSLLKKPPMVPNRFPSNMASMDAVRLALNSHLMKQDYLQPNRFFMPPQNFPMGLPIQAITPSSSVRQPGAPYFLSPSSHRPGRSSKSSSSSKHRE